MFHVISVVKYPPHRLSLTVAELVNKFETLKLREMIRDETSAAKYPPRDIQFQESHMFLSSRGNFCYNQ